MELFCILAILLYSCELGLCRWTNWQAPWIEKQHDPTRYRPAASKYHKGHELPASFESPNFLIPEDPNPSWIKPDFYREENRAYRLSPSWKMIKGWVKMRPDENMHNAGCYCTTVYKRLTPLAGCAVITTRHVLTTATSTYLILRDRKHYEVLENILGVWYDTNHNTMNSSMYLTPARIHFHPEWHYPEQVNRSHPFSFTFDLSVWASTYTIYGWYFNSNSATVCLRATSHPRWIGPPRPAGELLHIVIGFQFMLAYNRRPMPWYKYAVRSWRYTEPCPKVEWGWFICIPGWWARFGVESGAALHRTDVASTWKYDGLIGLAAFSMTLRSAEIIHYFTVLDCYPVLDFIYDAYTGRQPYVWKDIRFEDTKRDAPKLRKKYFLFRDYRKGKEQPWVGELYHW